MSNDRFKFRAWDKIEKVMCRVALIRPGAGAYLVGNSPTPESFQEAAGRAAHVAGTKDGHYCDIGDIEIMQWTGLHDSEGVEIFEGDIVVCADISGSGSERVFRPRKVEWQEEMCEFNVPSPSEGGTITVVGNIYEHPELVEPKK